jgi:hypothetical protein
MAIGPIGGMIYSNQNMHLQAQKQTSFQNRVDMQNLVANASANEQSKEVREVRPAESVYKIDPEKEHEREKNEEETGEKQEEMTRESRKKKEPKEEEEEPPPSTHHLDIKV